VRRSISTRDASWRVGSVTGIGAVTCASASSASFSVNTGVADVPVFLTIDAFDWLVKVLTDVNEVVGYSDMFFKQVVSCLRVGAYYLKGCRGLIWQSVLQSFAPRGSCDGVRFQVVIYLDFP
jgi:hypothetical protein